jgi:2'-5' RNA ligase
MRLFTAIVLSDDARAHLDDMGDRFFKRLHGEVDDRALTGVKWVQPENIHLTLKFLGEVEEDRVSELVDRLRGDRSSAPPSTYLLRASRLTFIPPSRGPVRVIAASVGDDIGPLTDTYNWIERACNAFGIPRERQVFLPHITLARCRIPLPLDRYEVGDYGGFTPGPWFDASQFALVQSTLKPEGPEYRTIATFPAA